MVYLAWKDLKNGFPEVLAEPENHYKPTGLSFQGSPHGWNALMKNVFMNGFTRVLEIGPNVPYVITVWKFQLEKGIMENNEITEAR